MAHLRRGADGHLLRRSDGHLALSRPCPPTCCGPIGACCFSSDSQVSVTWTIPSGSGQCHCSDTFILSGTASLTYSSCAVWTNSQTYSSPGCGVTKTRNVTVQFDPAGWLFAISDAGSGMYNNDSSFNPIIGNCCGGTSNNIILFGGGGGAFCGNRAGCSVSITVSNNNCCKTGSSCGPGASVCGGSCDEGI